MRTQTSAESLVEAKATLPNVSLPALQLLSKSGTGPENWEKKIAAVSLYHKTVLDYK